MVITAERCRLEMCENNWFATFEIYCSSKRNVATCLSAGRFASVVVYKRNEGKKHAYIFLAAATGIPVKINHQTFKNIRTKFKTKVQRI